MTSTSRADAGPSDERRGVRRIVVPAFARLPAPARRTILHALGKYAPWEDGFDPTPPRAEPGQVTGPPDFVGIGVQKAGTTWWYDAVCAHPDVFSRAGIHKERHFFGRYATRPFGPQECSRLPRVVPPSIRPADRRVDARLHPSPVGPGTPGSSRPRARLLVLLRDPVDRFRSGLAHRRRDRGRLTVEAWQEGIERGFYDQALHRWLAHFPPEQILVLQYEHCVADPTGQLARTYRFLELEPFVPTALGDRVNATARTLDALDDDVRGRLIELYTPDVRALATHFSEVDLSAWPNFSGLRGD